MRDLHDGLYEQRSGAAEDVAHERAVDLEQVDRELLEVGERRVAGPEVVDGEPDAEVAQPPEPDGRRRRVLHQRAFGDLEDQALRLEAAPVEERLRPGRGDATSRSWRGATLTLTAGVARCRPCRSSRAASSHAVSSTCWPISSMRPGLLGERDERQRAERSALGVLPANERFQRRDAARLQLEDRLVVHDQLAASGRAAEVRFEVESLDRARGASRRRTRGSSSCRRPWRCTSRGRRCGAARRRPAPVDPYAMPMLAVADDSLTPSSTTGSCEHRDDALGDVDRVVGSPSTSSIRTANSSPPSRAAVSPAAGSPAADRSTTRSSCVAGRVPEAVVDGLEVVEVDEQHRELPAVALEARAPRDRRGRGTAPGWRGRSAGRGTPGASARPGAGGARVMSRKLHTRPTTSPSMRCGSESRSKTRPSLNSSMSWLSTPGSS